MLCGMWKAVWYDSKVSECRVQNEGDFFSLTGKLLSRSTGAKTHEAAVLLRERHKPKKRRATEAAVRWVTSACTGGDLPHLSPYSCTAEERLPRCICAYV